MTKPLDTYRAEFLALSAGREHDGPVLFFTMRPDTRCWDVYNFSFTPAQTRRIRAELDQLLSDPESWLHVGEEQGQRTEEL
jgi:hypothetical protein